MAVYYAFVLCEFVILALICGLLIQHYKGSMVSRDVTVTVYLSWVLGYVGILLLPYDMSIAIYDGRQSATLNTVWRLVYWSTFVLAWMILPIQMEYHHSGYFTFSEKMMHAIYRNVLAGIVAAVCAIGFIVFLIVEGGSFDKIIAFMMAMTNTYGIVLIIVLMGNGLVSLPRRLYQMGDYESELQSLYIQANSIETAYQEARFDLEDCEIAVENAIALFRTKGVDCLVEKDKLNQMSSYIDALEAKILEFNFEGRSKIQHRNKKSTENQLNMIAKKDLVDLHSQLIVMHIKANACDRRWRVLIARCLRIEKILSGESEEGNSKWCSMRTSASTETSNHAFGRMFHDLKVRLHQMHQFFTTGTFKIKFNRSFYTALSIICAIFSILVLWSEMMMPTNLHSVVGFMMGAYDHSESDPVIAQGVSFIFLSYMSICTYFALSRLNLGWGFRLQGPQQSPPSSLIFNGEYLARLQFPLGYNFLLSVNSDATNLTAFSNLMANIQLIPVFGTSFTVYVPILMVLVALCTFFNVFSRLLKLLGIESEDPIGHFNCCKSGSSSSSSSHSDRVSLLSDEDQEKLEVGKRLVKSELRKIASRDERGDGSTRTISASSVLSAKNLSLITSQSTKGTEPVPFYSKKSDAGSSSDDDRELQLKNVRKHDDMELSVVDLNDDIEKNTMKNKRNQSKLNNRFNPRRIFRNDDDGDDDDDNDGDNDYHNSLDSNSRGLFSRPSLNHNTVKTTPNSSSVPLQQTEPMNIGIHTNSKDSLGYVKNSFLSYFNGSSTTMRAQLLNDSSTELPSFHRSSSPSPSLTSVSVVDPIDSYAAINPIHSKTTSNSYENQRPKISRDFRFDNDDMVSGRYD